MYMPNLNHVLPQEDVHKHFMLEGSRLYRKLASGASTQLSRTDGKQVITVFENTRLRGVDIAWCLIYGNWPEFPIVQLKEDILDFSESNLYPARTRRLRYVETRRGLLYLHPLSAIAHISHAACRLHWEQLAREFYIKDVPHVLRLQDATRTLRLETLKVARTIPVPDVVRPARTSRPRAVPGREWHWVKTEWVSIPEACHVADDYRERIRKQADGAVRFAFNPGTRMVEGFDQADGLVP